MSISPGDGVLPGYSVATAVTEVLHAYCALVDANRQADVVGLFAPDAVYDHGHGRLFRGADELAVLFAALDDNDATSHHLSNIRLRQRTDGTVAAHSYIYAYHRRRGSGAEVQLWGRYDDVLEAAGQTWLFRSRRLTGAAERGVPPDPGHTSRYERAERWNSEST